MYKCLHEYSIKTVPDTSLHETSDSIQATEVYYVETTFMLKAVKKICLITSTVDAAEFGRALSWSKRNPLVQPTSTLVAKR